MVLGNLNSNVTLEEYRQLTNPILDNSIGNSASVGWCPRITSENREEFEEMANVQFNGNVDFEVKEADGHGHLEKRVTDNEDMFPLLFSNPLSMTYVGLDFNAPLGVFDNLPEGDPIQVSNKLILSEFGGLSRYVDENYEPIGDFRKQNPVIFVVFHPIFNKNNDQKTLDGVVGVTFEPRVFINNVADSFGDTIRNMDLFVFRKRTFWDENFELIFDLNG